jgi:hypothetical protein
MQKHQQLAFMFRKLVWIAIIATLIVPPHAIFAQTTVPAYGKFEVSFTLPGQTGNPYDPAVNDVEASFHGPGGLMQIVPAFWDGDRWKVRYAASRLGRYALALSFNGTTVHPVDLTGSSFVCVKSDSDGFVRRDPNNVQSFQFDSSKIYYPLGIDVAWQNSGGLAYPDEFAKMNSARMNWARVWMNAWDGKNLEWGPYKQADPPIGSYSMDAARRWDMIMDAAAINGVYIQMTLQHHGQYTRETDPNWQENPFNTANGGFLKQPDDFFSDPEAIRLTKNKYRYIVARWGYSTHLMAFELFNEVQNIGEARSHFQDVVNWHKTMAAYIRSIDPYHHLITTSISEPGEPLSEIGLDYNQQHTYPPDLLSVFGGEKIEGMQEPYFMAEWGYPGRASGAEARVLLHDGLWCGAMMPDAGACEFWDWDTVNSQNFWPEYSSLSGFIDTFGISQWTGLQRSNPAVDTGKEKADLAFGAPGDWGTTTKFDVQVPSDGTLPDMHGVSQFIQGVSHREMTAKPIAFHLDCALPCKFSVTATTISAGGSNVRLGLDGTEITHQDFPAGAGNRNVNLVTSIDVPAGAHTVTVFNTGGDWFVVGKFTVTNFVPAVAVFAKANVNHVAFWVYDRNVFEQIPHRANLTFSGLKPGSYRVDLWDTQSGKSSTETVVKSAVDDGVPVKIPNFVHDVAGVVVPIGKDH